MGEKQKEYSETDSDRWLITYTKQEIDIKQYTDS